MKRLILATIFICIFSVTYAQKIYLTSTSPANNEKVSSVQKISLTYDFSEIYNAYPDIAPEEWGIAVAWSTTARYVKLYKGTAEDGELLVTKSISNNASTCVYGTNIFEFSFDEPIQLENGETYTLFISGMAYARTKSKAYTATRYDVDTYIRLIGVSGEGLNLNSFLPTNESLLKQIDKFTLSFNGNVTVANNAKAYIYEEETEIAQSVSMNVNSDDASIVDIDFGNTILYKNHKYSILIPENSILSATDGSGYQEINLNNYQGASYKYLNVTSVTPADNSEMSYLRDVEVKFEFPTGYNLGYHSLDLKMYLYKDGTEEPIGTYTTDYNTSANGLVAHISKYDLEPSSTYRVVLPEGQVVPGKIGETLSQYDLQDTTNPEVVLTYTTPSTPLELPRVSGMTYGIEDDGSIKIIVPGYSFDGMTMPVYVVEGAEGVSSKITKVDKYEVVKWYVTCPVYDITSDTQVKVADLEMLYKSNPYSDTEIWLVCDAPQGLYAGRTYNIVVPAGTLAPRDMGTDINHLISNEETPLALKGTSDPYSIVVTSGIADDATPAQLGITAYYIDGTVTAAEGATAKLMQGETLVKEVAVVTATNASGNTIAIADFCDNSHTPMTLESGAAYTLVLPQGSLLGTDGIVTNAEKTVAFTGMIPVEIPIPEYVSISLTIDDCTSSSATTVKGEPYTLTVTPEEDWEVKSLTYNGEDITEELLPDGVYEIKKVLEDAKFALTMAYAGELTVADIATGIAQVDGTDIRVYNEGSEIVVEGIQQGDNIRVYTVGGMLLKTHVANKDSVRISAPSGTYIIRVNNYAIKMIH